MKAAADFVMVDNRSGALYASGAIVFALLLRALPDPCPLDVPRSPDVTIAVPPWGNVTNLTIQDRPGGTLLTATSADARHRVVEYADIPKPGRYRVSMETRFSGSQHLLIELGGTPGQKYGFVIVDPKSGQILRKQPDSLDTGVEAVSGSPRWYRWWVDMEYAEGRTAFDFAILSGDYDPVFAGTDTCQVMVSVPTFSPLVK